MAAASSVAEPHRRVSCAWMCPSVAMDQADRGAENDFAPGHRLQLAQRRDPGCRACPASLPSSSATWSEPDHPGIGIRAATAAGLGRRPGERPVPRAFRPGSGDSSVSGARDVERQAQAGQQFAPVSARSRPAPGGPAPGRAPRSWLHGIRARARSICTSCCSMRTRAASIESRTVASCSSDASTPCCCSHSRWRSISCMASRTGFSSLPTIASISLRAVRSRSSRASAASDLGHRPLPAAAAAPQGQCQPARIAASQQQQQTVVKRGIRAGGIRSLPPPRRGANYPSRQGLGFDSRPPAA